uniref:Ovule protein n=1 Tax=Brugia timori TaxID=42155 RepID=A0A0R3QL37_9BILA
LSLLIAWSLLATGIQHELNLTKMSLNRSRNCGLHIIWTVIRNKLFNTTKILTKSAAIV